MNTKRSGDNDVGDGGGEEGSCAARRDPMETYATGEKGAVRQVYVSGPAATSDGEGAVNPKP